MNRKRSVAEEPFVKFDLQYRLAEIQQGGSYIVISSSGRGEPYYGEQRSTP